MSHSVEKLGSFGAPLLSLRNVVAVKDPYHEAEQDWLRHNYDGEDHDSECHAASVTARPDPKGASA